MDAAATIIFRSGKMWHLLEDTYQSRYAHMHIIVREVGKGLCFDSIVVREHHIYKTVWHS